jgi:hypothetical protein
MLKVMHEVISFISSIISVAMFCILFISRPFGGLWATNH